MADFNFQRGSEWRKWDLQVQTILDDNYVSLDTYFEELQKQYPEKCQKLIEVIGSEELVKKHDSKEYFFTDTKDSEKNRSENYSKLFLNFLDIFNDNIGTICITDHNYDQSFLIDSLLKESENTNIKVLPGVEVNVQGVHALIIFGKLAYQKKTYSDTIKTFLSNINIHSRKTEDKLTVSNESYTRVIDEVKKIGAVLIYPHCNTPNGLFQERGKTDRTHLADQFNYQVFNILQAQDSELVEKTKSFIDSKQELKSGYVFTLGSDARSLKDVLKPDDKGNYCWVKADPTFEGFQQIMYEPESRVYIGEFPPILTKVDLNKTKYIELISINKVEAYDGHDGVWFDKVDIPINSELVAIIGNKGSGKSALADIIGLLGNSKNIEEASFLSSKKFKKGNLAKNFIARLTWKSGDKDRKQLSDDVDPASYEKVKYLPQNWFETLCNDLDGKQFSEELEKVVFTHLTQIEKIGMNTFKDLIQYKSQSVGKDIRDLHEKLHTLNLQVVSLISKLHPNYEKEIREKLDQKQRELQALENVKPQEKENPDKNASKKDETQAGLKQIEELNQELSQTELSIATSLDLQAQISRKLEEINRFEQEVARFKQNKDSLNDEFNIKEIFKVDSIDKIISLTIHQGVIDRSRKDLTDALKIESQKCLTKDQIEMISSIPQEEKDKLLSISLYVRLDSIEVKRDELRKKLDKPQEEYQQYLTQKKEWEVQKLKIEGLEDGSQESTINYYKLELQKISDEIPTILADLNKKQIELSEQIYNKKLEFVDIYKSIKTRVDNIIESNQQKIENYVINIEAGFKFLPQFYDKVLSLFNLRAKGSFMEEDNARQLLKKILEDKDANNFEDIKKILETIISNIDTDARQEIEEEKRKRYLLDQIKDPIGFYDYLFGLNYLTENYQLKLDNKDLDNLSPGEKGALLLVFYLMLDQDDIPLIIDQPEDNLDNESVSKILVKFISAAKPRRQIIMVTHNPNLAVVADAEQIIHVQIDKTKDNTFSFMSGSIENDRLNKKIVDILEGTMPAFDKRRLRYFKD